MKKVVAIISLLLFINLIFIFIEKQKEEYTINNYDIEVIYILDSGYFIDTEENVYTTVKYKYKKGTTIIDLTEDKGYKMINEDKNFIGWYTEDGTLWNFETLIENSIKLYGKWD